MMPEVIEISVQARLRELEKELARMPGIADKEARGLVKELSKNLKAAERAAKKSARDIKDSGEKMGKGLEGAKAAFEGLGGSAGATAGQVEKAVQSALRLGTSVGPVGAVLGAGTVALGLFGGAALAVAGGLVALVRSADEAVAATAEFDSGAAGPPSETGAPELCRGAGWRRHIG